MIRTIPFSAVDITGGFWHTWQALNRDVTIHAVYDRFRETGRFDALRCGWKEGMEHRPHIFWDSDVAKWMEAAAYLIEKQPEPELEKILEETISVIEDHQMPDGYFNSYFITCEPTQRFQRRMDHELYCAGHWIEAAVAYYRATGRDRFLKIVCRYADLIDRVFRVERSAAFTTPGHEEIELALVKLYETTGEERYLTLSRFFVDQRGCNPETSYSSYPHRQTQSHAPVREQHTAEGHAVRAGYLYCAMADHVRLGGDDELRTACRDIFRNIVGRRMYVTGGVGSDHIGEVYTTDYDLPNDHAYAETCAAISLALFARRMQCIENDAVYADTVERVLYNGFLSGLSLDGTSFFYENPLALDPRQNRRNQCAVDPGHYPITLRKKVFDCSCCPPNVTRFLASIGDFLYTADDNTIYCHQFMASTASFDFRGGTARITQETAYPADGSVTIRYSGPAARLAVRIPYWMRTQWNGTQENGYAIYDVADGSEIRLTLDLRVRIVRANPCVGADSGRVAVMRGPVVYCAEGVDNGADLRDLRLARDAVFTEAADPALGVVLTCSGFRSAPCEELYPETEHELRPVTVRLIPYHTFANRGESEMQVWLLRE